MRHRWHLAVGLVALLALVAVAGARPARADEGWTVERFHADITIQPDTSLMIVEEIAVDFGSQQKHGIFRYIPVVYDYSKKQNRVYDLTVRAVTDARGKPWKYETSDNAANEVIKIGDPDVLISGKQTYRITYRVAGALNGFDDHDELFWNVNGGDWPVPMQSVSATVHLADGLQQADCYQGFSGSQERCTITQASGQFDFAATRPLKTGEQLTIVAGIRKGALPQPELLLERKPRDFLEYFELKSGTVAASGLLLFAGLGALVWTWWENGRDRRYTSLHYLTQNPEEETRPLFKGDQIVVEFQPPEHLRPAEMGLLLDERADKIDITATIVDLAVRGHLKIEEIPKKGLFGSKDWKLTKTAGKDTLLPFEEIVYTGLFESSDEVKLSDLKNKFYKTLQVAQKALYREGTKHKWFSGNPQSVRTGWTVAAVVVIAVGGASVFLLGNRFGLGILGLPIVLVGLLLLLTASKMVRRTAQGSELLRRTLGFREYIATAETDRQRFNEQANIFAAYLPYAMIFGLVERWARAFRDIDTTAAVGSWYAGAAAFNAASFSDSMQGFSSQVSSTIASTPGGSGGSGFGGGAGGGGGGGGGGSW